MTLLVLCLGNDLIGDDAVGLLAADALSQWRTNGAHIARSALSGLYLLDLLEGFDDLIVLDAVLGETAGEVVRLGIHDVGPVPVPSAHYVGLAEALATARASGLQMPERIAILAVTIRAEQVIGAAVSPEVRAAIPDLLAEAREVAASWGHALTPPVGNGGARRGGG